MPLGPDLIRGLTRVQSSCAFVHPAQGESPSHRILRTAHASHTRRWFMIQMPPKEPRERDHLNAESNSHVVADDIEAVSENMEEVK